MTSKLSMILMVTTQATMFFKKTAEILKSVCSKDNFIARVGGEEFAILFTNSDHNQVIRCLEKLRVK